jgi:hypothetical protein
VASVVKLAMRVEPGFTACNAVMAASCVTMLLR